MSKQNTSIRRTPMQDKILDLEKEYFDLIKDVIFSDSFIEDLLVIEKEIQRHLEFKKQT